MSVKSAAQVQDELNRAMRANSDSKLGDLLAAIIANWNAALGRLNSASLSSAGLVIKAGSSAVVKAASAFAAMANGVLVTKPVNTDMAALAGSIADGSSAAWAFYIDSSGTLSASAKTADAASAAAAIALIPDPPAGKAQIGFVVVSNATGSPFVGGTTALDAASVTAAYYNTVGVSANFLASVVTALTLGDLGSR